MDNLKASLTASVASVMLFTPFDTIRTQMCIDNKNQSIKQVAKNIIKQNGFKGLYRGLGITLMTSPISTSLYLSLYEQIKHYFSIEQSENSFTSKVGASIATGAIVNTLTNPLWLIKTKVQANIQQQNGKQIIKSQIKNIYNNQGIKGYYQGLGASYLGLMHVGIYFSLYEELKIKLNSNNDDKQLNTQQIFIASSLAKMISIFATYPTTLLQTKLQVMESENLKFKQLIKNVYTTHGIAGFFKGIKIETIRSLPANALTFVIYEHVKLKKCF